VTKGGAPSLDLPGPEVRVIIAGVPGSASQIILDFLDPGGARTGKLLPTGNTIDTLRVQAFNEEHTREFTASLIDATNPTVIVSLRKATDYPWICWNTYGKLEPRGWDSPVDILSGTCSGTEHYNESTVCSPRLGFCSCLHPDSGGKAFPQQIERLAGKATRLV